MPTEEDWNIPTLRAFYDERLEENQRRSDERYEHLLNSEKAERDAIDRRFEAANRYKETYSEVLARISNEALKRVEFDSRMSAFQEKIDVLSKVNWPVYSSFAGIVVSMIVGLWVIIGLKIDATNQPVVVALEQAKIANESRDRTIADLRTELRTIDAQVASSAQADANSRTDRAQLNERIRSQESLLANESAERKSTEATLRAALVEIETQFCAEDSLRNLSHATDLRIMSILWQTHKLGTFPTDNTFYPQVCNRNIKTDGK